MTKCAEMFANFDDIESLSFMKNVTNIMFNLILIWVFSDTVMKLVKKVLNVEEKAENLQLNSMYKFQIKNISKRS